MSIVNCQYYNFKNGKCRIPHYEGNIRFTSCNCSEWDCYYKQLQTLLDKDLSENELQDKVKSLEDKLIKVAQIATYYKNITKGAGAQSMNIMDKHSGMAQVGKEILDIVEREN